MIERKVHVDNQESKPIYTREHLLTPNQAATYLNVTPEQIRSLIRQGQLFAVNVGTGTKRPLYRITKQALNDFLNRRWQPGQLTKKKKFRRLAPAPDLFPDLK